MFVIELTYTAPLADIDARMRASMGGTVCIPLRRSHREAATEPEA